MIKRCQKRKTMEEVLQRRWGCVNRTSFRLHSKPISKFSFMFNKSYVFVQHWFEHDRWKRGPEGHCVHSRPAVGSETGASDAWAQNKHDKQIRSERFRSKSVNTLSHQGTVIWLQKIIICMCTVEPDITVSMETGHASWPADAKLCFRKTLAALRPPKVVILVAKMRLYFTLLLSLCTVRPGHRKRRN